MSNTNKHLISVLFGKHIRILRTAAGLSQESLATLSGLDRSYIGGVERGDRNISLVNIHKLAIALNVTLAEIFKGVND